MLITEVEGSLATDGVKDIDAATLHCCVAARELDTRGTSAWPHRSEMYTHNGFHSDALADTLERDIESSGPTFRHVSPFVQAT